MQESLSWMAMHPVGCTGAHGFLFALKELRTGTYLIDEAAQVRLAFEQRREEKNASSLLLSLQTAGGGRIRRTEAQGRSWYVATLVTGRAKDARSASCTCEECRALFGLA